MDIKIELMRVSKIVVSSSDYNKKLTGDVKFRLKQIDSLLTKHEALQKKDPDNYGFQGDLEHVSELLGEVVSFLK